MAAATREVLAAAVRDREDIDIAVGLLMDRYAMTASHARILVGQLAAQDHVSDADAARSLTDPDPRRTCLTATPSGPLALALVADLRDLAVDLAAGGYTRTTLAMLERDLLRSVSSALGATMTLHRGPGQRRSPVDLVARTLQPEEIHATLCVPLRAAERMLSASITFYAAHACAFVDLAVDLADLLGVPVDPRSTLPDHPVEPGTSGLTDLTTVNIALGHLLNRGRTLTQARTELAALAEHHDTDLTGAARLIRAGDFNFYVGEEAGPCSILRLSTSARSGRRRRHRRGLLPVLEGTRGMRPAVQGAVRGRRRGVGRPRPWAGQATRRKVPSGWSTLSPARSPRRARSITSLGWCRWLASADGEQPPPADDPVCRGQVIAGQGGVDSVVELPFEGGELGGEVLLQPFAYRAAGTRQDPDWETVTGSVWPDLLEPAAAVPGCAESLIHQDLPR